MVHIIYRRHDVMKHALVFIFLMVLTSWGTGCSDETDDTSSWDSLSRWEYMGNSNYEIGGDSGPYDGENTLVDGDLLYVLRSGFGLSIYQITPSGSLVGMGEFPLNGHLSHLVVNNGMVVLSRTNHLAIPWEDSFDWLDAPTNGAVVILDASDPTNITKEVDAVLSGDVIKTGFVNDVVVAVTFRSNECPTCDPLVTTVTTYVPDAQLGYAQADTMSWAVSSSSSSSIDFFGIPIAKLSQGHLFFSFPDDDDDLQYVKIDEITGTLLEVPVIFRVLGDYLELRSIISEPDSLYVVYTSGSTVFIQPFEKSSNGQCILMGQAIFAGSISRFYNHSFTFGKTLIAVDCKWTEAGDECEWTKSVIQSKSNIDVSPTQIVIGDGRSVFQDDRFVYFSQGNSLNVYDATATGVLEPITSIEYTDTTPDRIMGFSHGANKISFVELRFDGDVVAHAYSIDGTSFTPFEIIPELHVEFKSYIYFTSFVHDENILINYQNTVFVGHYPSDGSTASLDTTLLYRDVVASASINEETLVQLVFDPATGEYALHTVSSTDATALVPTGIVGLSSPIDSYVRNKWISCDATACFAIIYNTVYSINVSEISQPTVDFSGNFNGLSISDINVYNAFKIGDTLVVRFGQNRESGSYLYGFTMRDNTLETSFTPTDINFYSYFIDESTLYCVGYEGTGFTITRVDLSDASSPVVSDSIKTPGEVRGVLGSSDRIVSLQYQWHDLSPLGYDEIREQYGVLGIDYQDGAWGAALPQVHISSLTGNSVSLLDTLNNPGGTILAMGASETRIFPLVYDYYSKTFSLTPISISSEGSLEKGTPFGLPLYYPFARTGCGDDATVEPLGENMVKIHVPCSESNVTIDTSDIHAPFVLSVTPTPQKP
jgi:hypothetical protein